MILDIFYFDLISWRNGRPFEKIFTGVNIYSEKKTPVQNYDGTPKIDGLEMVFSFSKGAFFRFYVSFRGCKLTQYPWKPCRCAFLTKIPSSSGVELPPCVRKTEKVPVWYIKQ